MKIVNRQIFLSMPEGTIYSEFKPDIFGHMQIKGSSLEYDFLCIGIADAIESESSDMFHDIVEEMYTKGISADIDFDNFGRDGMFNKEQLFAVWEKKDLLKLREVINHAIEIGE